MSFSKSPTVGNPSPRLGDFVQQVIWHCTTRNEWSVTIAIVQKLPGQIQFYHMATVMRRWYLCLLLANVESGQKKLIRVGRLEGMQEALICLYWQQPYGSTPYSSFGGFAAMLGNKPIIRATEDCGSKDWMRL